MVGKRAATVDAASAASHSLQTRSGRCIKQNSDYIQKCAVKRERQNLISQIKKALGKPESERSKDEIDVLKNCQDLVQHVDICEKNRATQAAHQEIVVDDEKLLEQKCAQLAKAISEAKSCIVYTGAGISTSASIPDYRGPNGVWTMIEKGVQVRPPDFSQVEPTYSHMALKELVSAGLVKHVVSQNCDGLHLRSGIERAHLSELHGNCFIEFCPECYDEYVRLFDVTEKSIFRKHATGRYCRTCNKKTTSKGEGEGEGESRVQLRDSIIHFGEKLRNGFPYNWEGARDSVRSADLIICLGSSLKVLKHYPWLWPKKASVSLYIVNIQWTPKDKQAKLKINGYCDQVMKLVVTCLKAEHHKSLNIPTYSLKNDLLIQMATELDETELATTTKSFLSKTSPKRQSSPSSKRVKSTADLDNPATSSPPTLNSWFTRSFKNRAKKGAQKSSGP